MTVGLDRVLAFASSRFVLRAGSPRRFSASAHQPEAIRQPCNAEMVRASAAYLADYGSVRSVRLTSPTYPGWESYAL